jgi:hypothetical protein
VISTWYSLLPIQSVISMPSAGFELAITET